MSNELNNSNTGPKQNTQQDMMRRDGEIYVALGCFIVFVGIPVLAGTYFAYAEGHPRAAVVNLVCSLVLLLIGVASIVYGRLVLARHKRLT
ncbi:MAG: hypothetical protein K1Y02_18820 [Candidatus Hydrogenedentes bacterium]|nr:hypothetical protein [Candidatus Hydrogenedentota bacterium]